LHDLGYITYKNYIHLYQNACVILALGLFVFSSAVFLTSNNDEAAGFRSTNVSHHLTIQINPGASNPLSQHALNSSSTVTIPVGSDVTWVNEDNTSGHTIVSGEPAKGPSNVFYSPLMGFGEKFTFRFNNAGVYPYYDDNYHYIKGQIIVEPVNDTSINAR
jgi:plastocyanin